MRDVRATHDSDDVEEPHDIAHPGLEPDLADPEPARLTLSFTVFTSEHGRRMSKRFAGGPFDTIVKYSGVQLARGRARRVDLKELTATEALKALKAHLQNLTCSQAIGLTATRNGHAENAIITRDQEADWEKKGQSKPDHIARTIANFPWPNGTGFLLCDADDSRDLRPSLIDLWPGFAHVAMLVRPSASAGIRHTSSEETLTGGEHVFLAISDMTRSRAVLDGIMRLAWVAGKEAGRGFIKIARDGSALVRGPVDVSTASPERLVFEGPPEVEPPIEATDPRIPVVHPGGVLDVDAFLAFVETVAPVSQVEARIKIALGDLDLRNRQEVAHAAWLERRVAQIIEANVAAGIKPSEAEVIAKAVAKRDRKAFKVGVLTNTRVALTGDDTFTTDQGEAIRLQEVLDDPAKHNGKTGPDPIDGPDSERGKAKIMGFPENGKPFIGSFARGGCKYDITPAVREPTRSMPGGSLAELQARRFEPLRHVADPLLVEGCTLISGNPKMGKSWKALQIGLAVSTGTPAYEGYEPCPPGDVLYLALEDNERRMQRRVTKLLGLGPWPANMEVYYSWPRANEGGLDRIRQWVKDHPNARLVMIDVLNLFRKPAKGHDNTYQADAEAMQGLQQLAAEMRVAILVVHHNRKSGAEGGDPFEMVSGTMGLTGGVDAVLVLRREAGIISLYGRGRDGEDIELGMALDRETLRWSILGQTADVKRSGERNAILDALRDSGTPMTPKAIADATERPDATVRRLLHGMMNDRVPRIQKVGTGYTLIDVPDLPF